MAGGVDEAGGGAVVVVDRLNDRGEGIVRSAAGDIRVPFALPGEEVEIESSGERRRLLAVREPGVDRVAPICPLFERCGGCALQHLALPKTLEWKRGLVVSALARNGVEAPVDPCRDAHGAGRRRVTFHVRRVGGAVRAGFMAARTHDLVPVAACPVLAPGLAGAAKAAEALGAALAARDRPLDVQVTSTATGLDVDIRGHGKADRATLARLAGFAAELDLARLSLHGDVVAERRRPVVRMGRAMVAPPPGGFLQATEAGEEVMAGLVAAALAGARRAVDLFAGCGPFALRIAETIRVHAADSDAAAIAALLAAHRATPGLKPLTAEARDLFRRPPLALDLTDAAVAFDPPRAGAEAVARALAASKVAVVAALSCNPATFARDAAILVAGGFRLEKVTPVDQFRYAAHVELVAVFRR